MESTHSSSFKVVYNDCFFVFRNALIFRYYSFSFFSSGRIFCPSFFRLSLYVFFFFLVLFLFLFLSGFPFLHHVTDFINLYMHYSCFYSKILLFKKYLNLVHLFYFKHRNFSFSFVFISFFICGVHFSLSLLFISTPYCVGLFMFPFCKCSFKAFYALFWVPSPLLSVYRSSFNSFSHFHGDSFFKITSFNWSPC